MLINKKINKVIALLRLVFLIVLMLNVTLVNGSESNVDHAVNMEKLLSELHRSSPAVKSSFYKVESAELAYNDSKWLKYPTPSFRANSNADDNQTETIFSLNQPIWTGGKISNSIEIERSNILIAETQLKLTRLNISNEFIDVLGNWIAAKARLKSYLKASVIYEDLYESITRRVELGVSPNADKLLIDSRIRNLNNDIAKEENQLVIEARKVSNYLGRMVSTIDMSNYGFSEPLSVMPEKRTVNIDELYTYILNHPQIQVLNNEIIKLELEYMKQKKTIWPSLSVELRHTNQHISDERDKDTAIFLNLESSWGSGLSSLTGHDKILSEIESKKNDKLFQIQSLNSLYANELLIYELAKIQIDNVNESIESSEEVYRSYKRQYLAGKKTWLELLNAVQEIVRYEIELGELLASMFITSWKLELLQSKEY